MVDYLSCIEGKGVLKDIKLIAQNAALFVELLFTWSLHHPGGYLQTKLFDERVVVEVSFGYKVPES